MPGSRAAFTALSVCALYVLVSMGGWYAGHEPFPFFTWHLFSKVPAQEHTDFGLRLLRDGEAPRWFEDAGLRLSHSIIGYSAIQELGKAVVAGSNDERERRVVEETYLDDFNGHAAQVVQRRFDILEHPRCDCYLSETVVATIRVGSG